MSTAIEYDIGDVVKLAATFRDAAAQLADPSSVALRILKPDGTVVTPTPVRESLGLWSHDLSLDLSGWWTYRFIGSGANQASDEGRLFVRKPLVPLA